MWPCKTSASGCVDQSHIPKEISSKSTFPTPLQTQITLYFSLTYILKSITSVVQEEKKNYWFSSQTTFSDT